MNIGRVSDLWQVYLRQIPFVDSPLFSGFTTVFDFALVRWRTLENFLLAFNKSKILKISTKCSASPKPEVYTSNCFGILKYKFCFFYILLHFDKIRFASVSLHHLKKSEQKNILAIFPCKTFSVPVNQHCYYHYNIGYIEQRLISFSFRIFSIFEKAKHRSSHQK